MTLGYGQAALVTLEGRTSARLCPASAASNAMRALVRSVFLDQVTDGEALALGDGAALPFGDRWLVLTTDAHVVAPLFSRAGTLAVLRCAAWSTTWP